MPIIVTSRQSILRPTYSAGGGGGGSNTLTGSGFGTNADYAPVKFLDFVGLSNGLEWVDVVGTGNGHVVASTSGVTSNADGIPMGGGCWLNHVDLPDPNGNEWFPHESILIAGGSTAVTVFKHAKIQQIDNPATNVAARQYKSTRIMEAGSSSPDSDYGSTPRIGASAFDNNSIGPYVTPHYWREGGGETNQVDDDTLDLYDEQWHCNLTQVRMNSANNVADAIYREWWDGTYNANTSALDLRDNTSLTFHSVQHNPGMAEGFRGHEWNIKHARIVVIKGLAWCAFGNASTFSACTDLLVVEPTSWSDTTIQFNPHGTRPSGYDWMYVMKTDGNLVSSSGSTSFS